MKPDVQRIFTKLAKEKVELANIKDFKSKNKIFEKAIQNFTSDIVSIVNAREDARKKYTSLVDDFSSLDKEYQEIKRVVMDLGTEMPNNIESDYKIATQIMKQSNSDYKELVR